MYLLAPKVTQTWPVLVSPCVGGSEVGSKRRGQVGGVPCI